MKTKVGTALDRELIRSAKSVAAREGKRLNQVIEEALTDHLRRKASGRAAVVVARTAGCLKMPQREVLRLSRAEPGLLDR